MMKPVNVIVLLCLGLMVVSTLSAAEADLPKEFVQECQRFIGVWDSEVTIDGVKYRGQWHVKWSADKTCLDTHWHANTPNGPARGTRIEGWDAAAEEILVVDFGSAGTSSIERYTLLKNRNSKGVIEGVDEQGKRFQATALTVWKNPDYFIWTVTRAGEEFVHHFRRKKKGK